MDMEHGREVGVGESQRSIPTPFLTKTYQLVDEEGTNDVISWNEDGSSFVVWNTTAFARDLLPNYFKHNNFSSFVRQLNTYGFKKLIPDRWEFSHDCFRRGQKHLLRDIHRRKINPLPTTTSSARHRVNAPTVPSSLCGSDCASELADENERLRKENVILSEELTHMKSLCSNIFSLMSSYANMTSNYQSMPTESKPSSEESESPRLFGVPIRVGTKRLREEHRLKPEPEPSEDCHAEQWFFRQTHGPEVNVRTVYN